MQLIYFVSLIIGFEVIRDGSKLQLNGFRIQLEFFTFKRSRKSFGTLLKRQWLSVLAKTSFNVMNYFHLVFFKLFRLIFVSPVVLLFLCYFIQLRNNMLCLFNCFIQLVSVCFTYSLHHEPPLLPMCPFMFSD